MAEGVTVTYSMRLGERGHGMAFDIGVGHDGRAWIENDTPFLFVLYSRPYKKKRKETPA